MKSANEWDEVYFNCEAAYLMAPKWSPYRLIWKFGMWYAERNRRKAN